jgi:hypothetical protein
MDRENTRAKINEAVQRGLALCRHSVAPIVALSQFVDELRSNPAWNEADVAVVEAAIRHILVRVVGKSGGQSTLPEQGAGQSKNM